jgi:putative endonuclease
LSIVRTYYVYIVASASRVLYVGVTSDLEKRLYQHKHKAFKGFTAKYNVDRLVYYEGYGDVMTAIEREKRIKGLLRRKKIALIEHQNPAWRDLAAELWPSW